MQRLQRIASILVELLGNIERHQLPEVVKCEANESLRQAMEEPEGIDRIVEAYQKAGSCSDAREKALRTRGGDDEQDESRLAAAHSDCATQKRVLGL